MSIDLVILIVVVIVLLLKINTYESFNEEKLTLFNDLMNNHYDKIFPNNANRNAAGFRFFKYIYDNLQLVNNCLILIINFTVL